MRHHLVDTGSYRSQNINRAQAPQWVEWQTLENSRMHGIIAHHFFLTYLAPALVVFGPCLHCRNG